MADQAQNDFQSWHKRFDAAQEERTVHARSWNKILAAMHGTNFRPPEKNRRGNPINQANNFGRVVLPHLLPRDRRLEVTVTPKRPGPDYARSAEELGDRLTAVAAEIRLLTQARRCARAAMYSIGWLKVGFEVRTGILAEAPSSAAPGQVACVDVDRDRVEGKEFLDAGLPYCCWVPASRMLIDAGATALEEGRWVDHQVFRTKEALAADPRFAKVADQLNVTHSQLPRSEYGAKAGGDDRAKDPLFGFVELHEVYDRDRRQVLWIPGRKAGLEGVAAEGEWPKGIEGFPFARIEYEEVEGYFYPNPILSPTYDLMTMVDTLYRHITQMAKEAKRLILYDPDVVKPEQIAAIENAKDSAIIPVRGLTKSVTVVDLGGVHADHWKVVDQILQLSDQMSGVGDFLRSSSASSPSATATEVQSVMQATGVRLDDMKHAILACLNEALGMLAALLIEHADMLQDIALPMGDPREQKFVALGPGVTGEGLDYGYEVVASSTERVDPAIKQKRLQDLIAQSVDPTLAQKLASEGKAFHTAPLLERQLRALGEKNIGEFFVDLPGQSPQLEQQRAQQEDQIMVQTGVVLPVGPNDDHQTHYAVHYGDWQSSGQDPQSPIAQHLMMHEQYLMQMQQGQQGGQASGQAGGQGPGAGGQSQSAGAGTAGGAQQAGALRQQAMAGAA